MSEMKARMLEKPITKPYCHHDGKAEDSYQRTGGLQSDDALVGHT